MARNRKTIDVELRQILEEGKSENDALKKLIRALKEAEMKVKLMKNNQTKSPNKSTK